VAEAAEILAGMLGTLGRRHTFLPDDISSTKGWPAWCRTASRTTDAHLLALAVEHGAEFITLDTGIPGAVLLSR
jgi:predicted nucleic acid-binding protein